MAVIATFGAVVAYRAVTAEEDTSNAERRLEQGQILELNRRADLLNTYRESAAFEDSENLARSRGFYLQRQAAELRKTNAGAANAIELRKTNAGAANAIDLQSEEQFAIARMYRRIRDYNYVGIDANDTIEVGIEKNVARELSEAGYGAAWTDPPKGRLPNIWSDLQADIAKNRRKTVWLSGLVAVFVLALAFLTFTQLPPDGAPLQRRLERFAYAVAIAACVVCFVIDAKSWLPFLLAGAGIALVAYWGHILYSRPAVTQWLNGPKPVVIPKEPIGTEPAEWRAPDVPAEGEIGILLPDDRPKEIAEKVAEQEPPHPHEVGPRIAFIGSHLMAWDCTSTMNRFALSLIAITALLAAICGWRYDCATAYASGAAGRAMDQQVIAFKNFERTQIEIHYVWGLEARMHESRLRYKAAEQRAELARQNLFGLTGDREPSQMDWQKQLLSENHLSVEQLDGSAGPEMDPYFPEKEAQQIGGQETEAAFARWDAENELRQAWHNKAAQYLLTLTMFAIALYLLGQSMGMGLGRGAFILVLGGSLISGVGAFCALKTAVHYLPRDAQKLDPAADAYGAGRKLFLVAHESDDYQKAADQFQAALKVRPTFALAHYYYGESLYNSARLHPDESDSLPTLHSDALKNTVKEMGVSLDDYTKEGITPPEELVGRYGFFTLLGSVSPPNISLLRQGIAVLRDGIKSYKRDTWLEENLAIALLITGKTDEAKKAYDQVFADDIKRPLAIGALGDLEIAHHYCGIFPHSDCATIQAEIAKLKPRFALIAGPQPDGARWDNSHALLSDPELSISPSVVSWNAVVNAKAGEDVLVVVWYWKDPEWDAWRVVSSVSGKVNLASLNDETEGRKSYSLSYLYAIGEHRCLGGGEYRAEFYLNGKLVAEQSKTLPLALEFKGVGLHDVNFEACYPATWSDWSYTPGDVTGRELVRGSYSPDHKRGVFVFSFFYPRIPDQSVAILDHAVLRSDKILEGHGLSKNLTFARIAEPCPAFPVDVLTRNAVWYQDSTRTATVRAWIAEDGIVYVALAANIARTGMDTDDCLVLTGLSNIYGPAVAPPPPPSSPTAPPPPESADPNAVPGAGPPPNSTPSTAGSAAAPPN